jgi:hypothetical protein
VGAAPHATAPRKPTGSLQRLSEIAPSCHRATPRTYSQHNDFKLLGLSSHHLASAVHTALRRIASRVTQSGEATPVATLFAVPNRSRATAFLVLLRRQPNHSAIPPVTTVHRTHQDPRGVCPLVSRDRTACRNDQNLKMPCLKRAVARFQTTARWGPVQLLARASASRAAWIERQNGAHRLPKFESTNSSVRF